MGLRLVLRRLLYLIAMTSLLNSCTQHGSDSRSFDEMLALARASYAYPVTDYADLFEPTLTRLIAAGDARFESGRYEPALQYFLEAEDYILRHDRPDSLLLLIVLDRIVLAETHLGLWKQADRAQHRYHEIIRQRFAGNQRVLNRADFRLGCWHFVTGDWYQAQFDFEDAIQRLENNRTKTVDDNQLLTESKAFEDTVAFNCQPMPPLP